MPPPAFLRIKGGDDLANEPVLASAVERLEHDQERLATLSPESLLELGELTAQLLEPIPRSVRVPVEARSRPSVDRFEVRSGARDHAKEFRDGQLGHGATAAR